MTEIERKAAEIGGRHGRNAAGWVFDGNTSEETYRRVLKGIDDGDPEVMDAYRAPDLSGEFADSYSEDDLAEELDTDRDTYDGWDEAANAYSDAAGASFWSEVERLAIEHLSK